MKGVYDWGGNGKERGGGDENPKSHGGSKRSRIHICYFNVQISKER